MTILFAALSVLAASGMMLAGLTALGLRASFRENLKDAARFMLGYYLVLFAGLAGVLALWFTLHALGVK